MINILNKSLIGFACLASTTTIVYADETIVDGMRDASLRDVRGLIGRQFADGGMTMSRSGSAFHQTGTRVFQASVVGRFRGVVSQADMISQNGEVFGINKIVPIPSQGYPGYIALQTEVGELRYSVEYSDLLPLVLVADAEATSLYSLTSDINDESLNSGDGLSQWAAEAGMVIFEDEKEVAAVEIAGTPIQSALMFADLCRHCETEELPGFADYINQLNNVGPADNTSDSSWIISDVGVRFDAVVSGDRLWIDGAMTRNRWVIGNGQTVASVTSVSALSADEVTDFYEFAAELTEVCLSENAPADCDPLYDEVLPSIYDDAFRDATLLGLDLEDLIMEDENLDFVSIGKIGAKAIARAEFAFETLVLLRHAKAVDPVGWKNFTSSISTEGIMAAHLDDWRRYAGSLQQVAQ